MLWRSQWRVTRRSRRRGQITPELVYQSLEALEEKLTQLQSNQDAAYKFTTEEGKNRRRRKKKCLQNRQLHRENSFPDDTSPSSSSCYCSKYRCACSLCLSERIRETEKQQYFIFGFIFAIYCVTRRQLIAQTQQHMSSPSSSGEPILDLGVPTASMTTSMATPQGNGGPQAFRMVQTLPLPGTQGAPYFDGKNVTKFVMLWEELIDDIEIPPEKGLRRLPRYCSPTIEEYIRAQNEYLDQDWSGLKKKLVHEFEKEDEDQQMSTRAYLEVLRDQCSDGKLAVRAFIRQYGMIAKRIEEKNQLDAFTKNQWLLQGLPESLRRRVMKNQKIQVSTLHKADFDKILNEVDAICKSEEAFDELSSSTISTAEKNRMKELAVALQLRNEQRTEEEASKPNLKSQQARESSDDKKKTSVTILQRPKEEPQTKSEPSRVDKLTEAMDRLTISTNAIMENQKMMMAQGLPRAMPRQGNLAPQGQYGGQYSRQDVRSDMPPRNYNAQTGGRSCWFCEGTNHMQNNCFARNNMLQNGQAYLNDRGKLCIGSGENPAADEVRKEEGITLSQSANKRIREWEEHKARAQEVTTSLIELEDIGDDSEFEEVDMMAAAAQKRGVSPSAPDQKVWRKKVRNESSYPTVKNWRPGAYKEQKTDGGAMDVDRDGPGNQRQTLEPIAEAPEQKEDKIPPAKNPKLAEMIKASADERALMDKILDQCVNAVTVRDLLSSSSALHRLFFARTKELKPSNNEEAQTTKQGASEAHVGNLVSDLGHVIPEQDIGSGAGPRQYAKALPTAVIQVNGVPVRAMFDSGSEINVMRRDVAGMANCVVTSQQNMMVRGFTGAAKAFDGVVEETDINIGNVHTSTPCFVLNEMGYDMILGAPWMELNQFELKWLGNNMFRATVFDEEGQYYASVEGSLKRYRSKNPVPRALPAKT